MRVQEISFSPYELVLKEVEEGKLNPFDVDLEYLIGLFEEKAKELEDREFFIEAGVFLMVATRLLKLKLKTIFPEPKREKRKITVEEVKEVIEEAEEEISSDTLDWLYEYSPQLGRPKGSVKAEKPRTLKLKEFFRTEVPLHKEVDWHSEAKRVYEEIKKGIFRIRSLRDFIAFLFVYHEYEDFEVDFSKFRLFRLS
ncbi:MAG: segregation/condensation protein A [Aquifex sp.]|nr:MAG: segregation/condensation protein A [Aquifex sp.]